MKKFLIIAGAVFTFALLPKAVLAATIYLSPASASVSQGSTLSVSVRVNTQGAAVNTAEANISYSANLELVSVRQGTTFYLAAPGSPAKGSGTAYFGGGLPSPGYTGSGGILGTLTFRARALGTATVSISGGKVLLNDGLGSDAFSGSSGARIAINPPPVGAVVVTSSSHPDQNAWYAKPDVTLDWNRPSGTYGYSFVLDQQAETVPDNTLDTTTTASKIYSSLKDGVWYFHIRGRAQSAAAGFGVITHYKIQIDTVKPLLFDITLVGQTDLNDVTRTPTVEFAAKDELSGVDHYAIYVDGDLTEEQATSPYTFSKLETGPHLLRVVAVDKAGNDRKAELPIMVQTPPAIGFFQRNLTLPTYILLGMNLLILILFGWFIRFVFGRRKKSVKQTDEIAQIQADIDDSLEELRQRISNKLLTLTARTSEELIAKEEKIAGEVGRGISKTRKKIDTDIGKLRKKVKKQKTKILK